MTVSQLITLVNRMAGANPSIEQIVEVILTHAPGASQQQITQVIAHFGYPDEQAQMIGSTVAGRTYDSAGDAITAAVTAVTVARMVSPTRIARVAAQSAIQGGLSQVAIRHTPASIGGVRMPRATIAGATILAEASQAKRIRLGPQNLVIAPQRGPLAGRVALRAPATPFVPRSARPFFSQKRPVIGQTGRAYIQTNTLTGIPRINMIQRPSMLGQRSEKLRNIDFLAGQASADITGYRGAARFVAGTALAGSFLAKGLQQQRLRSVMIELFAGAEYAYYVEMGTDKMAPQPYLGPAVSNAPSEGDAEAIAGDLLAQAVSNAPKDTGALASSITVSISDAPGRSRGNSGVEWEGGAARAWVIVEDTGPDDRKGVNRLNHTGSIFDKFNNASNDLNRKGISLGDSYAIQGSGVLEAHGIRRARDVDMVVSQRLFNRIDNAVATDPKYHSVVKKTTRGDIPIVFSRDMNVQYTAAESRRALREVDVINGRRFVSLNQQVDRLMDAIAHGPRWKRPQYEEDLRTLRTYIRSR